MLSLIIIGIALIILIALGLKALILFALGYFVADQGLKLHKKNQEKEAQTRE